MDVYTLRDVLTADSKAAGRAVAQVVAVLDARGVVYFVTDDEYLGPWILQISVHKKSSLTDRAKQW